jgi:hypothetical protein
MWSNRRQARLRRIRKIPLRVRAEYFSNSQIHFCRYTDEPADGAMQLSQAQPRSSADFRQ